MRNTASIYINFTGDANTKICGIAKMQCLNVARIKFWVTNDGERFRAQCNCLQSCTFIKYKAEMRRTKLDFMALNRGGYKIRKE